MTVSGCVSCFQQLVGNTSEGAHYYHEPGIESAAHDADQPADGGCIFHRSATEFHDDDVITSLESAWPL
jgi:hypothetical protein